MFESIEMDGPAPFGARIKVIGVGGGGGNALNNMIQAGLDHVEYVAANTDAQALHKSLAPTKLQIGQLLTRGLGAGAKPDIGHKAAIEDLDALQAVVCDADMVFITAGMGGGTGTGAAPVVAQAAREAGALTVAIVTRPFGFEGKQRGIQADEGLRELADAVDTLIVIPNDRILQMGDRRMGLQEAFRTVDSVLVEAVRGISDIIMTPGLINVDFADVVSIMKGRGMALMGTGRASGVDRAATAARMAISSPLLEDARIEGATGLLVSITGGDLTLADINDAMTLIQENASAETNTIFGATIDESMGDDIKVTVVATGFDRIAATRHDNSAVQSSQGHSPFKAIPPPPPRASQTTQMIQVPVQVYAVAAQGEAGMHAATAQSAASIRRPQADIDVPTYQRNTPAYGTQQQALGTLRKPEPVMQNPFSGDADVQERPAYLRK